MSAPSMSHSQYNVSLALETEPAAQLPVIMTQGASEQKEDEENSLFKSMQNGRLFDSIVPDEFDQSSVQTEKKKLEES